MTAGRAARAAKIAVGIALLALAVFFVLHHGIFILGILALPGGFLVWDGARGPRPSR